MLWLRVMSESPVATRLNSFISYHIVLFFASLKNRGLSVSTKTPNTVIYYCIVVIRKTGFTGMKAAIIGLDGVPYHLLHTIAQNDTMPHIKEILKKGS
jgi:hypothetical protein